ncbi:MAG: nucleotide exchange factor GrpE [Synergistes sp.]|nr:nucleotide exchange factor GrpE [Synergistes sp.]
MFKNKKIEEDRDRQPAEDLKDEAGAPAEEEGSAAQAEEQPADETEALKEEIRKLKEEVARGRADYFNLRSRIERDRESNAKLAAEQAVNALLPVFENLERVAAAVEDKESSLAKGMSMVIKQFADSLGRLGLEFIPTEGEFDPNVHDAIFMEPVDDPEMDGKITGAVSRGYKLAGRLLKAPQVRVGKYNG